jgi:hypothetical protein
MSDNTEKFEFDKKLYTEDDIKNDPSAEVVDMTIESIMDIEPLTARVVKLLEFIDNPVIVELENTDKTKYVQTVNSQFEDIPFSIIKVLIDREHRDTNLEKLLDLFAKMQSVKNGEKDKDTAFKEYKEELNEEYIYPKFGGKAEFERTMDKKNKKAGQRKFD